MTEEEMEAPTSSLGSRNRKKRLILHDDDDDELFIHDGRFIIDKTRDRQG